MIKIENENISGWAAAIRGMRNPLESWEKSDSNNFIVGEKDRELMQNLVKAGTDHSKFMRMIIVTMDITAPLYWWKEFDTYKIGTVRNSCSTMHKIHADEITINDFSYDHLSDVSKVYFVSIIRLCEELRKRYIETNDKKYWYEIIQLLPSSYNQRATIMLNYEVLRKMYHARKNHKLDEWRVFCDWIEDLPYAKELITNVTPR